MDIFSIFKGGKYFDKHIDPKCDYCQFGKRAKDGNKVLCEKRGIVDCSYSCSKFVYSPLKRIPVKQLRFVGSLADEDIYIESAGDRAEKEAAAKKDEAPKSKSDNKPAAPNKPVEPPKPADKPSEPTKPDANSAPAAPAKPEAPAANAAPEAPKAPENQAKPAQENAPAKPEAPAANAPAANAPAAPNGKPEQPQANSAQ